MRHEHDEPSVGDDVDGRYRLTRAIARGGMGLVFEAEHRVTGQRVALKLLSRATVREEQARARLAREARVLGKLRHPNVVLVQDSGTCPSHGPYLVLELVEGRPLDGILLTRQVLPIDQARAVIAQLCSALAEVHRRGIVHRDLKPSNILISSTPVGDQVELIDFGVAKIVGSDDAPEPEKLTHVGELVGTREYMAPEQLMGKPVDERSDVYGAAVVLYECLVGEPPYRGPVTAIITQMLQNVRPAAPAVKRPEIPASLSDAVMRGLELEPGARFSDVLALRDACLAGAHEIPRLELLDVTAAEPPPEALAARRQESPTVVDRPRGRKFARAPYVAPARVVLPGAGYADGRTEDLSEGGVLFVTQGSIPKEVPVLLRMPLPSTGRLLEVRVQARWVKERRNMLAFGLEFLDLGDDARSSIRHYVATMTRGRG